MMLEEKNPIPFTNDIEYNFSNPKKMSEFLDNIKTDPVYRKAFDKGVSAGIVFLGIVEIIIAIIVLIIKKI